MMFRLAAITPIMKRTYTRKEVQDLLGALRQARRVGEDRYAA